jgi:enoyl-CoA hydratase/carnithine racemase
MFRYVGQDPENQCMILTGTGETWLHGVDEESFDAFEHTHEKFRAAVYDNWYVDGTKLQEHVLWARDFPVISVINGPGFHTEFGLLCDLTIAADDVIIRERHYQGGLVPGDGMFLVYQHLLGTKRAAYAMYMRPEGIKAQEALEWGLVNELHPREKLLPRAWEMAREVMKQERVVRNLTQEVVRRPWKKLFTDDFAMHFAHECFAAALHPMSHKANHRKYHKEFE